MRKFEFKEYVQSQNYLLCVKTNEETRAMDAIHQELIDMAIEHPGEERDVYRWDIAWGLLPHAIGMPPCMPTDGKKSGAIPIDLNPIAPLKWLATEDEQTGDNKSHTVIMLLNYHRYLKNIEVVQHLLNLKDVFKTQGKTLVMIVPEIDLPIELEKSVTIVDFDMPTSEDLKECLDNVEAACLDTMKPEEIEDVVTHGTGLTRDEFENSVAYSIAKTQTIDTAIINRDKEQIIKKTGFLEIMQQNVTFDDIGGLEILKQFCTDTIKSPLAKGVMLHGVTGTGKSSIAKALAKQFGMVVLGLNPGRLYTSLVGSSESNVRIMTRCVEAMRPCVLFIDEIGRGLASAGQTNNGDSGTSDRVNSHLLTWFEDRPEGIFIIATTNNITILPPEMVRRFDAIFFCDLPTKKERIEIEKIHRAKYNISPDDVMPDTYGYVGAEIEKLCRISSMTGKSLAETKRLVPPVSVTMEKEIKAMREHAEGRCVPASEIEVTEVTIKPVRTVIPKNGSIMYN